MNKINWRVRLKSKKFWLALIPALLTLTNVVANWFGYDINPEVIGAEVVKFIDALFIALILMGIVVDPTTPKLRDSDKAMKY